jgi:hypothetical protein
MDISKMHSFKKNAFKNETFPTIRFVSVNIRLKFTLRKMK